jgi:hypothetical protein
MWEGVRMTAWFLGLVTGTIEKYSTQKTLIIKANKACFKQPRKTKSFNLYNNPMRRILTLQFYICRKECPWKSWDFASKDTQLGSDRFRV